MMLIGEQLISIRGKAKPLWNSGALSNCPISFAIQRLFWPRGKKMGLLGWGMYNEVTTYH